MTEWSEHVKRYAKKYKMSYRKASMDSKCKESYERKKKKTSPRIMKEPRAAGGAAANGDRGARSNGGGGRREIPPASELSLYAKGIKVGNNRIFKLSGISFCKSYF